MSELKQQTYAIAAASVLTTELNTLATAGKAISAAIDNSSNLNLYDDLELVLAASLGGTPVAGAPVDVYILPAVDGTNYADGDASTAPPISSYVGSFAVRAVSTAQRLSLRDIPLPSGLFKYLLINNCGQSFAASGNTLKRRPHNLQIA